MAFASSSASVVGSCIRMLSGSPGSWRALAGILKKKRGPGTTCGLSFSAAVAMVSSWGGHEDTPAGLHAAQDEVLRLGLEPEADVAVAVGKRQRRVLELEVGDRDARPLPVREVGDEDGVDLGGRLRGAALRAVAERRHQDERLVRFGVEREFELAALVDVVAPVGRLAEVALAQDVDHDRKGRALDRAQRALELARLSDLDLDLLAPDP